MTLVLTVALLVFGAASRVWAQNCKPDVSTQDQISKEQREVWTQRLFSTSFMGSLNSSSEVIVTGTVGRYGALNAVNIQLQKEEKSLQNAAFESSLRAVKGNQFFFGLKDGPPLSFSATSVSNETKAPTSVLAGFSGKQLVTTVVLSAVLSDRDVLALRDALTKKQIDSVRILLAGDVRIDKSVNGGDGEKMRQKFSCFYQALDSKGINLSAAAATGNQSAEASSNTGAALSGEGLAAIAGRYNRKDNSDYIDLNGDGTFGLRQDGKTYSGTFSVRGDTLTGRVSNVRTTTEMRIVGNTLVQSAGTVWERRVEPQKQAGTRLTLDQIIQMVGAKIPDDIIVASLEKSGSKFELTPEDLIKLKTAGVSDAVLRAMAK